MGKPVLSYGYSKQGNCEIKGTINFQKHEWKHLCTCFLEGSKMNETLKEKCSAYDVIPKTKGMTHTQPYYRSRAFASKVGMNPLVTASSPIFFLIEKFQKASMIPNLDALHEDLSHEIRAFETHAETDGYSPQIIMLARHIICLWADEMILETPWAKNGGWDKKRLIHLSYGNMDQSFYKLLDHCLQDAITHLDLLELFYLCLSLGYEGEYKSTPKNYHRLNDLKDNLFHRIQHHRGNLSKLLEIKSPKTRFSKPETSKKSVTLLCTSIALLCLSVGSFIYMNGQLSSELIQTMNTLNSLSIS